MSWSSFSLLLFLQQSLVVFLTKNFYPLDQGLAFGLRAKEDPPATVETGAGGGGGEVRGGGGGGALAPVEAGGASPIPTLRKFPRAAVASDGRQRKQIIMSVFQHLFALFVIVCG